MPPAPSLPPRTVAPMTPAAIASVAVPASSESSFLSRLRPRRAHVVAGLTLGVVAEWLVDGPPVGVGLALVALAAAALTIWAGGSEGWDSAKEHRWLLIVAAGLFACSALQDAGWLTALEVVTGVVFAALAVHGWPGETRLATLSPWRLVGTPVIVGADAVRAGVVLSARELKGALDGANMTQKVPAAMRLFAIVVPPVMVVTALLASGDASFGARVGQLADGLLSIPIPSFLRSTFVALAAGVTLVGLFALAARRRDRSATTWTPGRYLKPLEAGALLGTLSAVLFAFGATTWDCALSPDTCALPPGVTYAEAAHEGFFQLLAAAIVILALLMALPARTALATDAQRHTFRALATTLVVGTLPMVLSAIARMDRYEDAYSLTRLRIMAHAGLVLVGAVMAWRALTLWIAEERFVSGALALVALSLFTLTALRPDELIARHNLRVGRDGVDIYYLTTLSDDAAPALVEAMPRLDEAWQKELRLHLWYRDAIRRETSSVGGWNVGRARADAAVRSMETAWTQAPASP